MCQKIIKIIRMNLMSRLRITYARITKKARVIVIPAMQMIETTRAKVIQRLKQETVGTSGGAHADMGKGAGSDTRNSVGTGKNAVAVQTVDVSSTTPRNATSSTLGDVIGLDVITFIPQN